MRKPIAAVLALAAVSAVTAGLLVAPTSASAAATCVLGTPTISAKTLVIGVTNAKTETVKVKVTSCTPTAAKDLKVTWWFTYQEGGDPIALMSRIYNGDNTYTYTGSHTFYPSDLDNEWAGAAWETSLAKTRGNDVYVSPISTRLVPDFKILRASRGDLDVWWKGSTKPPKGYWLYVNAYLQRANWNTGEYGYYDNKPVYMQFKPNGGSYKTITVNSSTEATGRTGGVFWVKATVDGCYRFVWKGNTTAAASTSKRDCVDVQ